MFRHQHADPAADDVLEWRIVVQLLHSASAAVLGQRHIVVELLGEQHVASPDMLDPWYVGVGNPDVLNEQHSAVDGMCSDQRYVFRDRVRDQPRIGVRRDCVKQRARSTGILNVTGDSQRGRRYRHTVGAR